MIFNNWESKKLGEVCKIKYGKDHKHLSDGNIPVYGSGGIMRFADTSLYTKKSVLIPRKGSLKNLYFVETPFWTVDTLFYTEIDETKIVPEFLFYQLKNLDLAGMNVGTAVPSLTTAVLNEIYIILPSLEVQKEIANILSSLDNKIANNIKINKCLEEMAQAVFKSWFKNDNSNNWQTTTLGQITVELRNKVNSLDCKVLSAVKTGNLTLSEEYFTKRVFSKNISKYILVEPLDFAYNPSRVNIGSLGINNLNILGCVSPVYKVFRAKDKYHNFLNLFFKSNNFIEEVKTRASGSVRQSLSHEDFSLIKLKLPPLDVVIEFNNIYDLIQSMINQALSENNKLIEIRDSLLPKLISGEISIK